MGKSPKKIDPHDMKIVSFQLGNHETQYVIDVRHSDLAFLAFCLRNKTIIGQNLKFDYSVIKTNCGYRLNNLFDVMIASQVLTAGHERLKHSLYELTKRYLGYRPDKEPELFTASIDKSVRMSYRLDEDFNLQQVTYGAKDVELTHMLYLRMLPLLKEKKLEGIARLEFDFVKVAAECELNGMPINTDSWVKLIESADGKCEELLSTLNEYAPIN